MLKNKWQVQNWKGQIGSSQMILPSLHPPYLAVLYFNLDTPGVLMK